MEYYNSIARGYDTLHQEEQVRKLKIIGPYLSSLPPQALILDVGCGSGVAHMLGNVIGIDPSRKLLEMAAFPVVEGVAESLPFQDNSFDAVMSVTALHHCTNIPQAIHEMQRVAQGIIILSILKKAKQYGALETEIRKQLCVNHRIDDRSDSIYVCTTPHFK